jgi:hypothetical protein
MALTFPNRSRSYDEAGQCVHFLGYDGMFEIPFCVDVEALGNPSPVAAAAETDHLAAFDVARASIYDVAREAYSHGRKNVYVLTPADFPIANLPPRRASSRT